jgi:hypothetical protein
VFALPWEARRDWIDAAESAALDTRGMSTAGFMPLQALGVPGWWPGQDEAFYRDATVFRPRRADHKEKRT